MRASAFLRSCREIDVQTSKVRLKNDQAVRNNNNIQFFKQQERHRNIETCTDNQGLGQGCSIFSKDICTDKQVKDQGCNIIATAICTDKQGTRDVTYYQQIYAQTIKVGQGYNILFTTGKVA